MRLENSDCISEGGCTVAMWIENFKIVSDSIHELDFELIGSYFLNIIKLCKYNLY